MRQPVNEAARLDAVYSYRILDTEPESGYDELTELAARLCGCSAAYIKFFDKTRAWFKAKVGFPPEMTEVPREITVCNSTICQADLVVVPDLAEDERFRDNPTVVGPPYIRFYCGMPLIDRDGYALGTFCVVDFEPRQVTFEQQEALRALAHQVVNQLELRRASAQLTASVAELERAKLEIENERKKVDDLLCNILPRQVADELKANGAVQARYHPLVTVMFADFQGFTRHAAEMEPAQLVQTLDQYFGIFDDIVESHGLEKIKTIGDSYMCAGGVPTESRAHIVDACLAALGMQSFTRRLNHERGKVRLAPWDLRIGIHTGAVMTGVVGRRKFTYDIWGDVVNIAQRLEAAGEAGRINVSDAIFHRVQHLFEFEPRGAVEVRGKGPVAMHFLNRIKPELSQDTAGLCPNDAFTRERHRLPHPPQASVASSGR